MTARVKQIFSYSLRHLCLLSILLVVSSTSEVLAQSISQVQKIFASDRENREHFGYHVQIFEDFAFISAKTEGTRIGIGGSQEGAVYVFKKNEEGTWIEHQKLVGSDRSGDDHFGSAIERSDSLLVIGAVKFGDQDNGAAYVFQLINGYWAEQARLEPNTQKAEGAFGCDLAIADEYIVVGAYAHGENITGNASLKRAGAAYIFKQDENGNWNQHQRLISPHPQLEGRFGLNVYMTEDYLAVGAQLESTNTENKDTLETAGAVYVYEKSDHGFWELQQKLVHSDRTKYDYFSWELIISGDEIFVGSPWKQVGDKKMAGAVYCFERQRAGNWVEKQKMIPMMPDIQDRAAFGYSLDVHDDILVIGGGFWKNNNGAAYVYIKNECGVWEYRQKITALGESSNSENSDFFASWVSLSSNHMLFGAIYDHNAYGREDLFEAGSAFIYEYKGFDELDRSCTENQIPPLDGSTFVDSILRTAHDAIPISFEMDTTLVVDIILDTVETNPQDTTIIIDEEGEIYEDETQFVIRPNPNDGKFKIEIIGEIKQSYPVTISKLFGAKVKTLTLIERITDVDLSREAKGLYIVKISTEDEIKKLHVFVK